MYIMDNTTRVKEKAMEKLLNFLATITFMDSTKIKSFLKCESSFLNKN
jgi:hypothetical protein